MNRKTKPSSKHHETRTYKLNDLQADSGSTGFGAQHRSYNPFSLPMRKPGWFPDGIDVPWKKIQRLFPEEVVGRNIAGGIPFGVQFCDPSSSPSYQCGQRTMKTTYPQHWILGDRLYEPDPAKKSRKTGKAGKDGDMSCLMCLMCDLAKRIRNYNASLYRLRRLHYFFRYSTSPGDVNSCHFPPANPHGDIKALPDPNANPDQFAKLVRDAENDWVKVTDELSRFIGKAIAGYHDKKDQIIYLMAADMVEVNGYVVSMRIVANPARHPEEPGGSSSHVSISSAFSSY